jgi:DNA repair protein RadC
MYLIINGVPDPSECIHPGGCQYKSPGQGHFQMKKEQFELDFSSVINEIEITYSHKIKPCNQPQIVGSGDTYRKVLPMWKDIDYRESFAVLLLSRANRILGLRWVSTGGAISTVIDAKIIFQAALMAHSSSIILLHNHPSGQLAASNADISITRKLKEAGEILDITVLDHIIISSDGYYSMADEGIF